MPKDALPLLPGMEPETEPTALPTVVLPSGIVEVIVTELTIIGAAHAALEHAQKHNIIVRFVMTDIDVYVTPFGDANKIIDRFYRDLAERDARRAKYEREQ